jgi:hypothetical protein
MITQRNDAFFMSDNNPIFKNYGGDANVGLWKNLWTSKRLDEEDRGRIWKWLDLFVALAGMHADNRKNIV